MKKFKVDDKILMIIIFVILQPLLLYVVYPGLNLLKVNSPEKPPAADVVLPKRNEEIKKTDNESVIMIKEQTFHVLNKENRMEEITIPELSLPKEIIHGFEIEPGDYSRDLKKYLFNDNSKYYGADPFVLDQLELKPDMIFSEIGIGSGPYTFAVADRVKEYYGQDIGESSIRFVKWRLELARNGFYEKTANETDKNAGSRYENVHLYVADVNDAKIPIMCDIVMMHQVHAWRSPERSAKFGEELAKSISAKIKKGGKLVIIEKSDINKGDRNAGETAEYLEQFSFKKVSIVDMKMSGNYLIKLERK